MKKKENLNLGALVTASIEKAKIKKLAVIAESGISRASFYRAVSEGGKASKPNVVALVRAINKLAGKSIIDETEAVRQAGFDADVRNPVTINIDTGVQLIVEKSKFSKKQLSSLTENLRSAAAISLRSMISEKTEQPKKAERKIKVIKKSK